MTMMLLFTTLFPVVLIGCLLPTLGRQRRGLLFGVSVPLEFADSPAARNAVRRYRGSVALLVIAVAIAVLLVLALGHATALVAVSMIAIPAELLGGWLLWLRERRAMRAHAAAVPLVRSANLAEKQPLGSIVASVAALLPLGLTAEWLRLHWAQIPARWPQHWNAAGVVNGWGVKSLAGVYFPLLLGALVILMFTAVVAFIALAPGPLRAQRRLALPTLAALTWCLAGVFVVTGLLPLLQKPALENVMVWLAVPLLATFVVVAWLVWRLVSSMRTGEAYDGTPDAMWHAGGLLYYNPSDASVLVAKRYGWGWTLNFARPAAWIYVTATVVFVVLVTVLPVVLKGR